MKNKIEKFLFSGSEDITLHEFEDLAGFGETNLIERKSIQSLGDPTVNKGKIKEILSKAMSAFGNHEGGFLLLGVDDQTGKIEQGIDNTFNKTTIKEWLEDILWTCCSPQNKDFSVKKVLSNSKYLFVIIFGKSSTAPNQANYGKNAYKYFSRVDGKSKPIDGILVRDIFNRTEVADLEINPKLEISRNNHRQEVILNLTLWNNSNIPAEKALVIMKLSDSIIIGSGKYNGNLGTTSWQEDGLQFQADLVYPLLDLVLLNKNTIRIKEFSELKIHFHLLAKNMPMKKCSFSFRTSGNDIKLLEQRKEEQIVGYPPSKHP